MSAYPKGHRMYRCPRCGCRWGNTTGRRRCPWCSHDLDLAEADPAAEEHRLAQLAFDRAEPR